MDTVVKTTKEEIDEVEKEEKELTEYQKFMDAETILVMTNVIFGGFIGAPDICRTFSLIDFTIANATEIFWINRPLDETWKPQPWPFNFQYLFALKISGKGQQNIDEAIERLQSLDFVALAWQNTFDYTSTPYPSEEKENFDVLVNEENINANPIGTVATIVIDKSFTDKIFIFDDFKALNITHIYWLYDNYVRNWDPNDDGIDFKRAYYLRFGYTDMQGIIDMAEKLYKLDFIKSVRVQFAPGGPWGY